MPILVVIFILSIIRLERKDKYTNGRAKTVAQAEIVALLLNNNNHHHPHIIFPVILTMADQLGVFVKFYNNNSGLAKFYMTLHRKHYNNTIIYIHV